MFKTRLLSGLVLVACMLAMLIVGGSVLYGMLLFISLIGLKELYRIVDVEKKALGVCGYLGAVLYEAVCVYLEEQEMALPVLAGTLLFLMAVYVFTFPKYQAQQVMFVFFGVVYVAVLLSYLYQLRMLSGGIYLVWLVILSSWGCDTCAYCVGMLFGKHKLAPVLSPKKSVEGAVGGVIGAGLLGVIYALLLGKTGQGAETYYVSYGVICATGAVIAQIGDLAASAVKRNYKIKDYGRLIPGHGGILDRFDSVIFTAPIIYYLSLWLLGA